MIVQVGVDDGVEEHVTEGILDEGSQRLKEQLPLRYQTATVTVPEVEEWVRGVVAGAVSEMRMGNPLIRQGDSLVLAGNAGRGKSWQAWGAMRALSVSGVHCRWVFVTAEDMFAALRPRPGVDSEAVFEDYATRASVLVIDDLGATKDSAWTEAVLGRIIDRRSKWIRPTMITTNIPPGRFGELFGARVTSRLVEMATVVPFTGPDLRRSAR